MQSALDSAIGLPSSSTSASWMLGLLMPDEQRRNFTMPPVSSTAGETFPMRVRIRFAVETGRPPKTHRLRPDPASPPQMTLPNTGAGDLHYPPTASVGRPTRKVAQLEAA